MNQRMHRVICWMLSASLLAGCSPEQPNEEHSADIVYTEISAGETAAAETVFTETAAEPPQSSARLTGNSAVSTTAANTSLTSAAQHTTGAQTVTNGNGGTQSSHRTNAVTGTTVRTGTTGRTLRTTVSTDETDETHSSAESFSTTTTTTVQPQPVPLYDLLDAMTLKEKAEQMMMSSASDFASAKQACERGAGAVCLFAGFFSAKSAEQVQQMTAELQALSKTPVLLSVDEEGGPVNRISKNAQLRSTPFRNGRDLYNEGGWPLVQSDTAEKCALLRSLGVHVNLAPVCDVPLTENDYIYARTFGLNADETAEYIRTVVTEMNAHQVGSVLKHFPGYGGSIDTHHYVAYDGREYSEFTARDFLPFEAGIAAGADAVMVSHNIVTCMDASYPASLSQEVHRILREKLHFQGVIVTDDLGMGAITQFTGGQNPAVSAVLAGNDIVTYAEDGSSADAIVAAVEQGIIPQEQINASVLRILQWKQKLGLL